MDTEKLIKKANRLSFKNVFKRLLTIVIVFCLVPFTKENSFATEKLTSENIMKIKIVSDYDSDTSVEELESFTFGTYPNGKDGKLEPIEWIALERRNGKLLALSKYVIDCKCYNHSYSNSSWKDSVLRRWLNVDFYNKAFNDEEKSKIQITNITNEYTVKNKTYDLGNTKDRIFILDDDEVIEYFGYESEKEYGYQVGKIIATSGTEYAKNVLNHDQTLWVFDSENEETESEKENLKWANGNSPFWLRSQGVDGTRVMYVKSSGYLSIIGDKIDVRREGVRPAMWIKY